MKTLAASVSSAARAPFEQEEDQAHEHVDRGDDEEPGPEGRGPLGLAVVLDAVDRGDAADQAEDRQEEIAARAGSRPAGC